MDLTRLIEALGDPAAYPYPVESVEVRQTHISAVFLAGPHAYKVKKPVRPGFLDFGTLETRRHFCDEEVRLNRRLAPRVYLGVVPVALTRDGVRVEGNGEVVEWAVKMVRLPDEATLRELIRRGEADIGLVEALARRVAAFHRAAEGSERIAASGRFEAVARTIRDVFDQASPGVRTTAHPGLYGRVRALAEESLSRRRPLIDGRAARGVPRDCHGDLRLDHVYVFPGREPPADLVIIDCVEFSERFRFIDPVADTAFAAMDLAFHGRWDLARAFADAYFRAAGDDEGRALLPLYAGYRAAVRGMVEGLLLAEAEVPEAERRAAVGRARAYWLLALAELEPPGRRPCLVLVAGLPGTGKSTVARGLADVAGFRVVRSDVVRKELAGLPTQGPTPATLRASLYASDWTDRTYAECLVRAERLVSEGKRVLIDATFREERRRQTFLESAVRLGVPAGVLLCEAGPETVRRRLENRRGDASDADWAIYAQAAEGWEEVGEAGRRVLRTVSTEGDPEQALGRAIDGLRGLGLHG